MNTIYRIRLLGPVQVEKEGVSLGHFGSRKALALLAYLVRHEQPVPRSHLAGLFWGDKSETRARRNLSHELTLLSRELPDCLQGDYYDLHFKPTPSYWVDTLAFEELVKRDLKPKTSKALNPPEVSFLPQPPSDLQADLLAEAALLYRGDFMDGHYLDDCPEFESWLVREQENWRRRYVELLNRLITHYLVRRQDEQVEPYLRRWLALEPWQEQAYRYRMALLARQGQRNAALAQYELCRQVLVEELGVEPAAETVALYEQIRAGRVAAEVLLPKLPPQGSPPPSPYRGLFAFREEDAPFFFGREIFIDRLVEATRQQPLVAMIGSSGSGKSSVIFAGLLPRLRQDASPVLLRKGHRAPVSWLIADFRPGSRPIQALASVLVSLLETDLNETDRLLQMYKLAEALAQEALFLAEVVERILQKNPKANRLLLVVDQFEELYTLCAEPETRQRFLDLLLQAVSLSTPLCLALALRSDFVGQALAYRPLADVLQDADIKLGPMTRPELRQAIENPAEKLGVSFESGLVERILDDVGDKPGNLPLLEFALAALWERQAGRQLTHAVYETIGQVAGALAYYADDVYASLSQAEQEQARRIFSQVVRPGDQTEDTRRLASRTELGEVGWALARRLADARLLVTSRDAAGQETVEVAHEALILNWSRLQAWLNEDRAFRTWQERLRVALRQWQASERDEGALLRRVLLAEAEEWARTRSDELSPLEKEFLEASIILQGRRLLEQEIRRQRELAQAQLALARQLAAQAISLTDKQLDLAILLSLEASRRAATVEERSNLLLGLKYDPQLATFLHGHTAPVFRLVFSPDGQILASASADQKVRLWRVATGQAFGPPLTGHKAEVMALAFSPDGQILASGGADGTIILWDVATRQRHGQPLTGHTDAVTVLFFEAAGQALVSASRDKRVKRWDWAVATGHPLGQPLADHSAGTIAFSPDRQVLATTTLENSILLWDITTGKRLGAPLAGHKGTVQGLAFSCDGQTLASSSFDRTIILWEVKTSRPVGPPLVGHEGRVLTVAFSPDDRTLASGGTDNSIILWEVETGQPLGPPLTGHNNWVRSLAFSPASPEERGRQLLASGSADGVIILWDTGQRQVLRGHTAEVRGVAFSPDGQTLASGSWDHTIRLWDLVKRQPLGEPLKGHTNLLLSVAFSPDGQLLASSSKDGALIFWDVATHQALGAPLKGHTGGTIALAFSPEGQILASCGFDNTIILWDVATRQQLGPPLTGHTGWVIALAFSPKRESGRRLLASGSADSTIRLWDVATGQALGTPLYGHTNWVNCLAFSPASGPQILASGSSDNTIRLWDISASLDPDLDESPNGVLGLPLRLPRMSHSAQVWSVLFNPGDGGKTLASGSVDGTVILWDRDTGEPLSPPILNKTEVETMAISPDGHLLALGGFDHTITLWKISWESWLNRACSIANRNFSQAEWEEFIGLEAPYQPTCPGLPPG